MPKQNKVIAYDKSAYFPQNLSFCLLLTMPTLSQAHWSTVQYVNKEKAYWFAISLPVKSLENNLQTQCKTINKM